MKKYKVVRNIELPAGISFDLTDQQVFHRQHNLLRCNNGTFISKEKTQWVVGEVLGISGDLSPLDGSHLEELKKGKKEQ